MAGVALEFQDCYFEGMKRTLAVSLVALFALLPAPAGAATPSNAFEEVSQTLRDEGLIPIFMGGLNFVGQECSFSMTEGAATASGYPDSIRFHISIDELDEGESPWNAVLGFTLYDTAEKISLSSTAQGIRIEAVQKKAAPPHGRLRKVNQAVELTYGKASGTGPASGRRVHEVRVTEDARTFICIIP